METEEPRRQVPFYVLKALAVLAIALGGSLTVIWLHFVGQVLLEGDWWGVPIAIFFGALIYGPGALALIFGVRALGRASAASTKRLIGSLLIVATLCGTVMLIRYCQAVGSLSKDAVAGLLPIATVAVAILLYALLSRALLRSLGLQAPAIQESLPRWPLMILAFCVIAGLQAVARDAGGYPDQLEGASASQIAVSFAPFPAAFLVYWVGKLLVSGRPD